jgi:hypothetical protein
MAYPAPGYVCLFSLKRNSPIPYPIWGSVLEKRVRPLLRGRLFIVAVMRRNGRARKLGGAWRSRRKDKCSVGGDAIVIAIAVSGFCWPL